MSTKINELLPAIHACPICGCTDIAMEVVVNTVQDTDGNWVPEIDQDDINGGCDNANNECHCTNPLCGKLYDDMDNVVELNGLTQDQYWKVSKGFDKDYDFSGLPSDERDSLIEEMNNWMEGLTHHPWEGVLGDTLTI